MRRRTGPVQQWVDSIPSPTKPNPSPHERTEDIPTTPTPPITPKEISFPQEVFPKKPDMTASAPITVPNSPAITMTGVPSSIPFSRLVRDPSFQSDSSHCSSVESLLEWRKADPEAILLGLGFGGCPSSPQESGPLSRIPRRFLQPSRLKGIAINDFLKHQQETSESFDSASLGYRGLTGSPYVAPSEIVQKIMTRLREHESHEIDPYAAYNSSGEPFSPSQQDGRLSVLSPDNRQYLERPRSKSPDMRNKRMIIGQKSFAFGCDGDLIEINASNYQEPNSNCSSNNHQSNLDNLDINSNTHTIDTKLGPNFSDEIDIEICSRRLEKRLAKQLSFDEDTSLTEIHDTLPEIQQIEHNQVEFKLDYQRQNDLQRISEERTDSEDQKDSIVTVISRRTSNNDVQLDKGGQSLEDTNDFNTNSRRASDSSCGIKPNQRVLMQDDRRRFSDGVMQTGLRKTSSESLSSDRRKSLRRQARVSDSDAIQYCGLKCLDDLKVEPAESDGIFSNNEVLKRVDESKIEEYSNESVLETLDNSAVIDAFQIVDKDNEPQRVQSEMAVELSDFHNHHVSKRPNNLESIRSIDDDHELDEQGVKEGIITSDRDLHAPGPMPKITGAVKKIQESPKPSIDEERRVRPDKIESTYEDAQTRDGFELEGDTSTKDESKIRKGSDPSESGNRNERQFHLEGSECSRRPILDSVQTTIESDDGLCCMEDRNRCCKSDKLGQICQHDKTSENCCYHVKSTNCWRKMAKIMKKNKKLEDMVVKSQQEMAEIRDMLSSVMSVRMEPGF